LPFHKTKVNPIATLYRGATILDGGARRHPKAPHPGAINLLQWRWFSASALRPRALAPFVFTSAFAATAGLIGVGSNRSPVQKIDAAPRRGGIGDALIRCYID
jgi:hypothetical protein